MYGFIGMVFYITISSFFIAQVVFSAENQNQTKDICNNNPLLGNNTAWSCTLESNCTSAGKLPINQTVTCEEGKICCPYRLPPTNFDEANGIALKKCYEYAGFRYRNFTIPGKLIDDPPTEKSVLDCCEVRALIVGGTDALPKEFPHMALLGFNDDVTDEDSWLCGGSLISEQFILSAAHCTVDRRGREVKWAALGLLSRENFTTDMISKNLFRIIQRFDHPQYKRGNPEYEFHDIALYKLEKPIKLSPVIRPICIHHESSLTHVNTSAFVTGWGQIGTGMRESSTLQKASAHNLDALNCVMSYKKGFSSRSMICGGHLTEDKDTCVGDSGGPMQVSKADLLCMWVQIGITSSAGLTCGENQPAKYTRVSSYLPWIQQQVWPTGT